MFRPNAIIAMSLAPELFNPEKAIVFLNKASKLLVYSDPDERTLGLTLLDPLDSMYDEGGNKTNSRRYLWLIGPFINAMINFMKDELNINDYMKYLRPYLDTLNSTKNLFNGLKDYSST
jgi:glycogen debranching enzyme